MEEQTININDREYSVSDLNDQQQYFLAQVNDLRQKISNLRFQLDQVSISEQHFSKMLIESVELAQDPEPVEE